MSYRSALLGGAAFATLATLGGVLVSRAEPAPTTRGMAFAYAPDSTPLFGPKRFNAPGSGSTIYTERFLAVAGSAYLLKVENGASDGTGRVSTGTIRLNSAAILSPSDFAGAPALLTRFVQLTASDTLKVELSAGSGQFVTVSVLASPNPRYPVHGPTLVTVQQGSQVTVNDNFTLPAGTSGPFRVHVVNGPDGTTRVSNATVTLNGTDVLTQNDINANIAAVERAVTLTSSNTVTIKVKQSSAGNRLSIRFTATDTTKPKITLTAPTQNALTGNTSITVSGSIDDKTVTAVTVNGTNAPLDATGAFSISAPLGNEGQNTLTITAIDANGNRTDSTRTVIRDTQPPNFDVYHPIPDLVTPLSSEFTRGPVSDLTAVTVTANGLPQALTGDGFFQDMVPLSPGVNQITFVATDVLGHTSTVVRTVVRDNTAPSLAVAAPTDNSTTTARSILVTGTATDETALGVTVNGDPVSLDEVGAFSATVPLDEGANVITVVATDAAGNTSAVVRNVTRETESLPPDPSTVAPPLDRTVATTMAAATEFLYTGANPIQTGVASGTIDPKRVAVLRGAVKKPDGSALPGVQIAVLDHPELGQTLSRADGAFDLAVNGGELVTIAYSKSGFLPVQRQVNTRWQDYAMVDGVVMIPLDTAVTTIDFTAPMQVARGTAMSDVDGTRRATVMFPQGTQATMVMPNGSTEPLTTMAVRATEYTVGESGPKAMPGLLPATSGYTYAVELSVDEAIAAGAKSVEFDRPIPVYVENFLGFPAGTHVPVASYDRAKAAWVPSTDGRIIELVGTNGGAAQISVDTSGAVADSATLAQLGITAAERQQLASLYGVGQTLWRMPVTHFTPIDGNYPGPGTPGATESSERQPPQDNGCHDQAPQNSVIECTTQVLGETLPIRGTSLSLAYRSNRVDGYRSSRRQEVRLTGATLPPNLKRVELEVEIAGRTFTQTFPAAANQRYTFEWDGKDAYGRRVNGHQPLTIRVGYVYPRLFFVPADVAVSFGLPCFGAPDRPAWDACILPTTVVSGARSELVRWNEQRLTLGALETDAEQMGGWALEAHHTYDPIARVLYYGDGRRRPAQDVITTVAGTGSVGTAGDSGSALQAQVWDASALATAPDGTVYFVDRSFTVRRVAPDGTISRVAGTGTFGYTGDGGPALQANIEGGDFTSIALGPDGSVYLGQGSFGVVRRIDPSGIITTVAGDRTKAFCVGDEDVDSLMSRYACVGDGLPATQASLWGPYTIAVGPDGSLYMGDGNYLIRKVSPDGIMSSIAGGGHASYPCDYGDNGSPWVDRPLCGDGDVARLAGFDLPTSLAVGPDGSLYVTESGNASIRRITPDGIITRFAGTMVNGFSGDGGQAIAAQMRSEARLAFGPDGSLFVGDLANRRIRRITPDGIITTIAGNGTFAPQCGQQTPPNCVNNELALQAALSFTRALAVGPDGSVYFGSYQGDQRIRRIVPFFRSFTNEGFVIASEDGSELFEFDARGRHLRTRDALTKRVLLAFSYDAEGRLTQVADADSNVTALERSASGDLTAIVGPFGQRTAVGLDARGWLARLVNPAGDTTRIQHDSTGLLVSWTEPRGNPPHEFVYDSLGLLTRDQGPDGGFTTVARVMNDSSVTASLTTAMGRGRRYGQTLRSTGTVERTFTDAANLVTRTVEATNGTTTVTAPDSSITTVTEKSDPRFGMQSPIASQFSVQMPSGLTLSGSSFRRVTLGNPNDPQSLTSQTDSLVVNGRAFKSVFDAATRALTQTSAEGRQTVTTLDTLGRVVEERAAGVAPVRYGYGPRGFLTTVTQAGRVLRYDYDSSGRVKKVTDPLGRFEQYAYDSVGRVVKQTLFNGREILYGYDANGNLTSLTPPGRPAHTFAYTAGNLDSIYSPPPAGLPVSATKYTFNLDRQLTRVLRPDSLAIDVAYDTAGRPSRLTLPNGQLQFAYSPTTGNLTTLTAPDGGTLSYTYDGSLPKTVTWGGAVQGSVGFKYDSDFRVAKIAVNGADSIAFGYDRDNLLTSAGAMTFVRDPQNGWLVRTVLGSDTSTWTYDDSTGAVRHYAAKHGQTTLFDVLYTRDSLDRIVELEETVEGVTTVKAFTYDSVGRVDQVRVNGVLVSDYDYDANGNRTSLTTQAGTVGGTYDDQDRMLTYGGITYAYTANGELRMKAAGADTTRYTYDALGNLVQVRMPDASIIDYLVDGQNRRIAKKVNGVLIRSFLYQTQLAPVAELDGSGQVIARFVYGARPNVPEYMVRGGTTYRIVTDHLGSVRLVVNAGTGVIVQRVEYDEFGRVILNSSPGFQPFGYAGGLLDVDTQLSRMGARDYDGQSGRWTTMDPLGFASISTNFYSYAFEDPVNTVDIDGLQAIQAPGFWEGMIPVWGPLKQSRFDFYCGRWGWGLFNVGLAALDATTGASAIEGAVRGAFKAGVKAWEGANSARRWYRTTRDVPAFEPVHHWAVEKGSAAGKWMTEHGMGPVVHSPLNLNPEIGREMHARYHGNHPTMPPLNSLQKAWYGPPTWAKTAAGSAGGHAANAARGTNCGC